jgi:hypothetical protein
MLSAAFTFYLGTHESHWLALETPPLFVSHPRLARRAQLPRAQGRWALDSGAFTELRHHGRWRTTVPEYIEATRRYSEEIGGLDFAFPMDWLCDPASLESTGLGVTEHQRRTIANFLQLRSSAPDLPFAPVIQGWTLLDYEHCCDLYLASGLDLTREPRVGVGSIAARQSDAEVREILGSLADRGLCLHGFGLKTRGLRTVVSAVASADSMSWSKQARHDAPLPGCNHRRCSSCLAYACKWRERLLSGVAQE